MLDFFSGSTRIGNTERAVEECMEIALGSNYNDVDLLIFHTSIGHSFETLVKKAGRLAPGAKILAASCCGIVGREGVSESMKDMALMAIKGSDFAISHTDGIYGSNSFEKCYKMALELKVKAPDINMIYFMASGIDIANDRCIAAIEAVFGNNVTVFGATSSDNMKGEKSYQAVQHQVFEHGAFMVGFFDQTLSISTQATHGFLAIGEPMIVTKSSGNIIEELNSKPAWAEFTERLGLSEEATCGDTIPIGALAEKLTDEKAKVYGNKHILRVVTSHEGNKMHYATDCPVGTELWLTVRDEERIFSEMDNLTRCIANECSGKKIVAIFHADCLARGRFLFNRVLKEELVSRMQNPFFVNGECPPWLGMYGFGEFARLGGDNTFHNYTTALYVINRN